MQKGQLGLPNLIILISLSVFAFSTRSIASQKDGLLKIYFLDIGQGDAMLIGTPSGKQILVDGGPDSSVLEKLSGKVPFYDRSLDMVAVSHFHIDHIGGLVSILDRFDVGTIVQASASYDSAGFKAWASAVDSEGAQVISAEAGAEFDFGDGVKILFLHPFKENRTSGVGKGHEDMAVAMLTFGDFKLLLTGDMEKETESELQDTVSGLLNADVLKVGHHGSKTSTTEDFLRAVSPQTAVIQVGEKNRYGHPAPEVLERFKKFDITYYRNDTDGEIKLVTDGKKFQISKY